MSWKEALAKVLAERELSKKRKEREGLEELIQLCRKYGWTINYLSRKEIKLLKGDGNGDVESS